MSLSPECQQWDLLFRRGDPGGQPEVITRTFFSDLQRSSRVGSGVPKEAERHPHGLHFWEGGGLGCVVRSVRRRYLGELAYVSHFVGEHRDVCLHLAALAGGGRQQLTAFAQPKLLELEETTSPCPIAWQGGRVVCTLGFTPALRMQTAGAQGVTLHPPGHV